jgi:predicted RND superfamily exporter protein
MLSLFQKRDPWGQGYSLWIVLGMAFALPIAAFSLTRLRLENDVKHWLTDDNVQTRELQWYERHFESEDNVIITWDGSWIDDPRLEQLANKLRGTVGEDGIRRGGMKQVSQVRTPAELVGKMTHRGVARSEALHHVTGVLVGPGWLRVQLSDAGKQQKSKTIRMLVEQARDTLHLDVHVADPFVAAVNRNEADGPEEAASEVAKPDGTAASEPRYDLQFGWRGMHSSSEKVAEVIAWAKKLRGPTVGGEPQGDLLIDDCFQTPGAPAAIALTLSEAGRADLPGTLAGLEMEAIGIGIDKTRLHLGGSPIAAAALNDEVLKSVWNREAPVYVPYQRSVVLLSGLVGTLLAVWLLRSMRLAVIVLLVSYYAALVSVALIPATGAAMNMVLVVLPTLLLVITISGAVHLANYWKHEAHKEPTNAIARAVEMAREPCILANVTTALGLASLMTSKLRPVYEFGLYGAIGTLLSLVAVLYGVPALLQVWPGKPPEESPDNARPWIRLGSWLAAHANGMLVMWAIIGVVSIYGLNWFQTETKVIRYFADDSQVVRDYRYLEENLAGIVPVEMVVRFGDATQEDLNFLDRMELVRKIQQKIEALPEISGSISLANFWPPNPAPDESASIREKLSRNAKARAMEDRVHKDQQAAQLLRLTKDTSEFHKPGDELWRITAQVSMMSNMNYATLTDQLDDVCQSELKFHAGTSHVVTGMVPVFQATQRAVLTSLIDSFVLAFVMIAAVMMILLRHPVAGLIAMVPNLLPVGIIFGLISYAGVAVDIGTMVTASVALGIAVDGTLHMLTWFRNGIREGLSRKESIIRAIWHCGPAMMQTSLAIGLALFVLFPAHLLLISRFGWLMAALIGAALLCDLLLTSVLLVGPLGYLLERIVKKQKENDAALAALRAGGHRPEGAHAPAAPHSGHGVPSPTHSNRRIDAGTKRH